MTDNNAFERFVADHLADDGSGTAQAERIAALIDEHTSERRQWPRWLALIKEPPMRTNSHLSVGSPIARVAAVALATILLTVALAAAGIAGQRLLATTGPIVVAQDGSGTYETITEAVRAAADGDEIRVRPGIYVESIRIDKDITLRGDGERDEVVIRNGDGAGTLPLEAWEERGWVLPYATMIEDSDPALENVTIETTDGVALAISGGSPRIERVTLVAEDTVWEDEAIHGLYLVGGSDATLSDIVHVGWLTIADGSSPSIADSDLTGSCVQIWNGSSPTISGSLLTGCEIAGWALDIAGSAPLLVGNTIGDGGIDAYGGAAPVVRDNIFRETGERGIDIGDDATGTIEDNEFVDIEGHGIGLAGSGTIVRGNSFEANGVAVDARAPDGLVEGNEVRGGGDGVVVGTGSLTLRENVVEGNSGRGFVIGAASTATLIGNRSCDNGDDLWIFPNREFAIDPSNEICDDDSTE